MTVTLINAHVLKPHPPGGRGRGVAETLLLLKPIAFNTV